MNQELVFDHSVQTSKNLAWWLYIAHSASLIFSLGVFSFVPLIINYVKRGDAAGTFVYSHHGWQIRSFWRSEEHTSELQSLMRISYAVFCLKKKTESTTTRYQYVNNDNRSLPYH